MFAPSEISNLQFPLPPYAVLLMSNNHHPYTTAATPRPAKISIPDSGVRRHAARRTPAAIIASGVACACSRAVYGAVTSASGSVACGLPRVQCSSGRPGRLWSPSFKPLSMFAARAAPPPLSLVGTPLPAPNPFRGEASAPCSPAIVAPTPPPLLRDRIGQPSMKSKTWQRNWRTFNSL